MKKILFIFCSLIYIQISLAADLRGLKRTFESNYNKLYEGRMCGSNIGRLIQAAKNSGVDLSNSYVLKIAGEGFLHTSGFYTRGKVNERAMLGYFHFVLVADNHVFDFDLDEPIVLELDDYIRLQFTPPYLPFHIFGIDYKPVLELSPWELSAFEITTYLTSDPQILWSKKLGDFVDLTEIMKKKRLY